MCVFKLHRKTYHCHRVHLHNFISKMESLPPEVQQIIAGCLNSYDLKALRLVNKRFSNIAARPLFEILNFSGNEQADRYELIGIVANPTPEYHKYPSRKRTVQYTELPEAVAEVLPLAKYVKTFKFSPAFYRESMYLSSGYYISFLLSQSLMQSNRVLAGLPSSSRKPDRRTSIVSWVRFRPRRRL